MSEPRTISEAIDLAAATILAGGARPNSLYLSRRASLRIRVYERLNAYIDRKGYLPRQLAWHNARVASRRRRIPFWRALISCYWTIWRPSWLPRVRAERGQGYMDECPEGALVLHLHWDLGRGYLAAYASLDRRRWSRPYWRRWTSDHVPWTASAGAGPLSASWVFWWRR